MYIPSHLRCEPAFSWGLGTNRTGPDNTMPGSLPTSCYHAWAKELWTNKAKLHSNGVTGQEEVLAPNLTMDRSYFRRLKLYES